MQLVPISIRRLTVYTASYHAEKFGFMLGIRFMAKFMSEAMESAE